MSDFYEQLRSQLDEVLEKSRKEWEAMLTLPPPNSEDKISDWVAEYLNHLKNKEFGPTREQVREMVREIFSK